MGQGRVEEEGQGQGQGQGRGPRWPRLTWSNTLTCILSQIESTRLVVTVVVVVAAVAAWQRRW